MKKMKKIFALLIAMVMVLGMSVSAFAQTVEVGGGTGSITINNATVGQGYTIYKLFDANPSGTQENGKDVIAYTASDAVYTWLSGNDAAKDLFTFTKNTAGTWNVEQKGSDAEIIAFLDSLITKSGDTTTVDTELAKLQVGTTVTATEATVKFDKIPFGYYVVKSSLGATVSVDSTNKDVTIIDKNQGGPDWDIDDDHTGKAFTDEEGNVKKTDGKTDIVNSANYGDVVNYVIGVNTTNYDGADQIINYFVKDTLGKGLTYNKTSLKVTVGETTLATDKYTVTWDDTNNGFEITVPWVDSNSASLYTSPNELKVYYSATVTDTAVIAGEGNKNTANFTYQKKNQDKPPYDEKNEKTTTTYVYALGLLKVATKTGSENITLAGAKFKVTDSTGAAVNVIADTTTGEYKLDTRADGEGVTRSNEVVTPANGVIIIKGLEAGKYTLTETEAPAGYNLLTKPVEIEASIAQTSTYKQTIITHYDSEGHVVATEEEAASSITTNTSTNVVPVSVENQKGTELPSTGGMGTTIFYLVGAILVLGAGVVLVTRRRMAQ